MSAYKKDNEFLDERLGDAGDHIDKIMIDDARQMRGQDVILILVVLEREGRPPSIVHQILEYGDDEGRLHAGDFVETCTRRGLLSNGERLEIREITLTGSELLTEAGTSRKAGEP
jgi:hypothetical protein